MLAEIFKNKKLRSLARASWIESFTFIFSIYLSRLLIIKIAFLKVSKSVYINTGKFILKLLLVIVLSSISILSYDIISIDLLDFIDLLNPLNLSNMLLLYFYYSPLFSRLELFSRYYLIALNLNLKIE